MVDAGTAKFQLMHYGFEVETSIFWTGLTGDWEGRSLDLWLKLSRDARVICDVGANTGVYALAAKAVNPTARVFAFEPVDRIYGKLLMNVALNGFDISCVKSALSDRDGDATLYDLPYEHVYAVMIDEDLHSCPSVGVTVKAERFDTFAARLGVERADLFKIDVETHEPQVLRGIGPEMLATRPTFILEVWNDEMGARVEEVLRGLGYLYFAIHDDGLHPAAHLRNPGRSYLNFLVCTPAIAERVGQSAFGGP